MVTVEDEGTLRATVKIAGWHTSEAGERMGKFILRLAAFRGLPFIRAYHTFIITDDSDKVRYRDIGWSLPFATHTYFFGTPSVSSGVLRGFGAYLLQRDDLLYKVYENGVFKSEGSKAEGWVTCGSAGRYMTLAVKDFWQQFPKEIEVAQKNTTIHFWPGHGEPPIRTGANLSIRNVYQQWFAHEGNVLDFKVPEEVLQHVKTDSEKYNWPSAKVANAMGLAKSHEMLLYFHTQDWEQARSREINRIFQSAPAVVVDPAWVCRTKVIGHMFPKDGKKFAEAENAVDETIANIERLRKMDRDYGMFNYGDSHHNWDWLNRRWNLHRIWRNTHHGWTRWPWMMYARSGDRRLLDWADSNARHVADVDHCHYTTEEFSSYNYPREKKVGGICDYKGFVHWASGGRRAYNSAADAMLWHHYMTGNARSLTSALEHGELLLWDGRPLPHREGSGRATSAAALYFKTWNNAYLEFFEKTVERLLSTQREDGSFPQWENFAPYLQRYVDLTQSRRGMKAMIRWADWILSRPNPPTGYHAKTNILAHASIYSGDAKYLSFAAYAIADFTDNLYQGSDPRYQGVSIPNHTNLHQSYFMQEVPYYLYALDTLGKTPPPAKLTRTSIRCLSREKVNGKDTYVFHTRIRQKEEGPFTLSIPVRGYEKMSYTAILTPLGNGKELTRTAKTEPLTNSVRILFTVRKDDATEYALRIQALRNFFVSMPMTADQPGLQEVYPIFREGITIGNGYRYYFNLPVKSTSVTMRYKGRSWPLQFDIYAPDGTLAARDTWIGSNDLYGGPRRLRADVKDKPLEGWSIAIAGYGQAQLEDVSFVPDTQARFHFAAQKEKLFVPQARRKE
jgi:hypothetical protein